MSQEFDRAKYYLNHILKPEDKFVFQCQMCGNCCRNRSESILLTGADTFRIAKKLEVSVPEAIDKYTTFGIGKDSKLPLLYLRERPDGSCSLLRKGKCTVQSEKPAVCAIYPLGRMVIGKDQHYSYFTQPNYCPGDVGHTSGATHSLEEWLSEFNIRPHEKEYLAWNKLATICSEFLRSITDDAKALLSPRAINMINVAYCGALYLDYDTTKEYVPQVEQNQERVESMNKDIQNIIDTLKERSK